MASRVGVINSALIKIGTQTINSETEQSQQARVCSARLDDILESLLQEHDWNFAVERVALAKSTEAPAFGYNYKYSLPSDCLQPIREESNSEFKVESDRFIHSNVENFQLIYLKKITDMNQLTPEFREALAYRLAAEVCYNLTGDQNQTMIMVREGNNALRVARLRDAQAETPNNFLEGSWIRARG